MPADATISWPKIASAASGNAVFSVCAVSSVGHVQDIPGRETTGRPLPAAAELDAGVAELDGCADVHAEIAVAKATAAPKTPAARPGHRCPRQRHGHGLAIAFPADPMLASIDTSLPAGNSAAVVVRAFAAEPFDSIADLFYNY